MVRKILTPLTGSRLPQQAVDNSARASFTPRFILDAMKRNLSNIWESVPSSLKNKYAVTTLAFLVYLMFFDSTDIPSQVRLQRHLNQLDHQTEYFRTMIEKDRREYEATLSTVEQMEKYARETYLMKRPDEDLYVIEVR